jgi:glycosidase
MKRSFGIHFAILALAAPLFWAGCADEFASFGGDMGPAQNDGGGGPGPDGPVVITDDGGVPPKRTCTSDFTFKPSVTGAIMSVGIGGEWNQFDPTKTPMMGPDSNGNYSASVDLMAGAYGYKFVVTQAGNTQTWVLDPGNPYSKYVGGVENSVVEVEDCKLPRLDFVKLDRAATNQAIHAEVQYVDGSDGAGFDPAALQVLLDDAPAPGLTVTSGGLFTVDTQGLEKTKHRLTVHAVDKAGHAAKDLHVPFWIEDQPFSFTDGTMYFAFTDRFLDGTPGNTAPASDVDPRANYEGGDFAGVQQTIESGYFDSLGVRTIWLSPPNANPDHSEIGLGGHLYTGYHGYWPTASRDTQKRFGDLDALKSLVKAAHKRGIRVIIDTVLNHVHQEHPYWQMHQNDGWFNPYTINGQTCQCGMPGCGNWDATTPDGNHGLLPRYSCWFEPYMPDLDYENFDALTAMIDDALFWAREVDVDGFRVDAVKHFLLAATVRLRSKLHDEFEHAQPLFYLVGETFDGDRGLINSFIGPNALHAQFDFPIYFNIRSALASYSSSLRTLEQATKDSDAVFGSAPMAPFLGNHDVTRFLSEASGQLTSDPQGQAWSAPPPAPSTDDAYAKLRLALTFVLTSPGVPLIYYGDEYGQPGAGDPDNRRFMKWSGYSSFEQTTLDTTKKLGAARAELVALQRGTRTTMWIDDDLYVFARVSGSDAAVVVINRQFATRTVAVPVPSSVPLAEGTVLKDRLGGPSVTVTGGMLNLNLAAHSSAVLAP